MFRHSVVLGDLCGKAKTVQALAADFSLFLNDSLNLLRLSLVILAILNKISEGLLLGEDRHFFSVKNGVREELDPVLVLVDAEVLDEPIVLGLANCLVAADAPEVCDQDILVFLNEYLAPEELDEGVAEELASETVVVLSEDEEHWALLHVLVHGPLDDAGEEDDQHLADALLVEKLLRSSHVFDHKFSNLLLEIRDGPVLEPFDVVIDFELLAQDGTKSSQDRLVEGVNLDRLPWTSDRRQIVVLARW